MKSMDHLAEERLASAFAAERTERMPLIATNLPDSSQLARARAALAAFTVLFLMAVPFARIDLVRVDAFIPLYTSARVVIEALTACLLIALYRSVGTRSVLVLGCGFVFSAIMAIGHAASFPGLLTPEGAFGTVGQTTAWIYFIWHGAFSVVLLAYGLMSPEPSESFGHRPAAHIATAVIGAVALAVVAIVWVASSALLPELMQGDMDGPKKIAVAAVTWLLNVIALVVIAVRRPRTVLDLWVMMVACACVYGIALAALLNHGRYDLGWYAGRVYGLIASVLVLLMLLVEHIRAYRQLVRHHTNMRRASTEQLQVAVTSLAVAQRAASAGFWDWEIPSGRLTWSDQLFHLFGMDPRSEAATFEAWRNVVHPDDVDRAQSRVEDALRQQMPLFNRYRVMRRDGTVRWVDAHGDVLLDAEGRPSRMTGLCIDVTDRVAAEEALRESEGKLRLFVEHAPSALAMLDDRMCYVAVSRRWMSDYDLDESIIGRCHYDVFPEIPERWKSVHRRALAGEIVRNDEDRFERKDGKVQWLRWEVRPWHRANGSVGGIVAMSEDVSERKHAQDALRESESRVRLLMELAPDGIFVLDAEGRCLDINQAGAILFGLERSEMVGAVFRDWIAGTGTEGCEFEAAWTAARGRIVTCEWRFMRRDGSSFIGETVVRGLPDGGLQAIVRDVTARHQAESALRDSEYFYRQTLESIPGMVFTTLPNGHCDYQSQQWVDYTGVPMSEHLGDGWMSLLHPDDRQIARDAWCEAIGGRSTYDLEYRVRRRDGVHEWFKVIGHPIRDAEGRIARWFGVAVNIERLKQADAELAQRSSEIEATLDAVPAMVYVKDARLAYARVNAAMSEMFGLAREGIVGRTDEDVMPPALVQASRETDLHVLRSRSPIRNVEQSWRDAKGGEHWISTSKSPFHRDDGSIAGLVGVSVDITEQKNVEAMRVQALERQRDALVREVHHRIKNHLQGVIGLLRYKSSDNPEVSSRMELAIAQIGSIAQVYGLQGRSYDTQLRLHELVESAIQGTAGTVVFSCPPELQDIVLSQSDGVPMALVINELITNAIKHCGGGGAVHVGLSREGKAVRVEIRGGPARLPPDFDYAMRRGLGTGLELASVLLPERRCSLRIAQSGDDVVAELRLSPDEREIGDGARRAAAVNPASAQPA